MNNNETLRDYQQSLRSLMDQARTSEGAEKTRLLGFAAGGASYLVEQRSVGDLNPISVMEPIPVAKPWAVGVANIKGEVHAITDFSLLLDGPASRGGKFMSLSPSVMEGAALLIDGITGLFSIDELGLIESIDHLGLPDWIVGAYTPNQAGVAGQQHFMIDVSKMSVDPRFSKLQSGE